jgi:hypothetical protein
MLLQNKNFQDFYNEIRDQFPKMKELDIWTNYDWSSDGFEHSIIMSELSREMAKWVSEGQESEGQKLMSLVERYFQEGEHSCYVNHLH